MEMKKISFEYYIKLNNYSTDLKNIANTTTKLTKTKVRKVLLRNVKRKCQIPSSLEQRCEILRCNEKFE